MPSQGKSYKLFGFTAVLEFSGNSHRSQDYLWNNLTIGNHWCLAESQLEQGKGYAVLNPESLDQPQGPRPACGKSVNKQSKDCLQSPPTSLFPF